jgi:hypothetical protein
MNVVQFAVNQAFSGLTAIPVTLPNPTTPGNALVLCVGIGGSVSAGGSLSNSGTALAGWQTVEADTIGASAPFLRSACYVNFNPLTSTQTVTLTQSAGTWAGNVALFELPTYGDGWSLPFAPASYSNAGNAGPISANGARYPVNNGVAFSAWYHVNHTGSANSGMSIVDASQTRNGSQPTLVAISNDDTVSQAGLIAYTFNVAPPVIVPKATISWTSGVNVNNVGACTTILLTQGQITNQSEVLEF